MILVIEPGLREVRLWCFRDAGGAPRMLEGDPEKLQDGKAVRGLLRQAAQQERLTEVAFRLPFGRDIFRTCERIEGGFFRRFRKLADWYPLYVPATCRLIELVFDSVPTLPGYAFFETGFFARLPDAQRYYALPPEYTAGGKVRKWGFHGILHEASFRVAGGGRVVSVVLDRQTTVSAVRGGKPVTVSLGQTPLEGVMGRTVSGDLDPGIVFFLMKHGKYSLYALDRILKEESGFRGMTGYDLTMKEFVSLYGRDAKVDLAFAVYQNQILKHVGEGIAAMGGVDAFVFSGNYLGVFSRIVYSLVKKLSFLGISLGDSPGGSAGSISTITSGDSAVKVCLNGKPAAWFIYEALVRMKGGDIHGKGHRTGGGDSGAGRGRGVLPAGRSA